MVRNLIGFSVFAVVAVVALKLLFGVLGFVFSLFWALLWLAAIGFVFYLLLKIISPRTAAKVKDTIDGSPAA